MFFLLTVRLSKRAKYEYTIHIRFKSALSVKLIKIVKDHNIINLFNRGDYEKEINSINYGHEYGSIRWIRREKT